MTSTKRIEPKKLIQRAADNLRKTKKKDAPGVFYKSTNENKPFFNRDVIFFIKGIAFMDNSYNYWISKTVNSEIINKRSLRQELFPLNEQFI